MRRLPPHGKEKCGSPRVTLRLHQLKEKKKDKLNSISADHHDSYNCRGMDSANKNGNTASDDTTANKDTSNSHENGGSATVGSVADNKDNSTSSGTTGVTGSALSTPSETDHHHGTGDSGNSSAPVKRTHSTDEDEDSKKKRRKDEASRGKTGSNSGGSPKSLVGGESEGEDAKSVESPGPKVPPLKIVIAGASLEEPGTGGRNGKNGSGRHHLPYVVSTTASTATSSSNSGSTATTSVTNSNNTTAANNSSSSTDLASVNTVSNASESHNSSGNDEPIGPRSPTDEPATSPSGGSGTGPTGRRVLRSHRITKVTDVCRSGGGAGGKEERGGSGHSSPATLALSESRSPRVVESGSPSPSAESSNPTGSATVATPADVGGPVDDKGNAAASSSSSTSSVPSSGGSSESRVSTNNASSTEESITTSGVQISTTSSGPTQAASTISVPAQKTPPQPELHPRKRKIKPKESNNNNSNSSAITTTGSGSTTTANTTTTTSASVSVSGQGSPGSSANGPNGCLQSNNQNGNTSGNQSESAGSDSAGTSSNLPHHDPAVTNSYQLFLNIRKQIERKRKGLFPVQPIPPQGFKDYLMNRCTYVLASNASNRVPPPNTNPPANLPQGIKDLYVAQEKERHRLLMQHVIEKEKLVLSVEQEILRVHGRAARALANQALPFSACTILRDEEVYSAISPEQEEKDRNQARSRYNGRLFLSWLRDIDDKWEKIKEAMLVRHHNEAESLHAVQKMDWEWKMKELGICEMKSSPVIDETHVPMVHVSDDFDLLST